MKHGKLKILTLCFLMSLCFFLIGCEEKYTVGIVPVYTEESRSKEELTLTERLNIEQGYRDAVKESKRYNKTVDPLYLHCEKYIFGFSNCSKALTPSEGWKENVRQFYALYYYQKQKNIADFMRMNKVNLLVLSTYIKNRKRNCFEVELIVYKLVPGSDSSLSVRKDKFNIPDLEDYQRLRLMCKESLMRIMDKIESANK